MAGATSKTDPLCISAAELDRALKPTLTSPTGTLLGTSFCCLSFLITILFLPTDLQASFPVPLPEAGACSLASCCLLVGRELQTVELTHRITTGGHCWTLTNIINTLVVAAGFSNLH